MVTWLQSYLNITENRAEWAYVADALIAHHVPASDSTIDERSKLNIFLQSWHTNKGNLPKDLQDMISVARKYHLRMEGLAFSRETIRQMPIWLHREASSIRRIHNSKECRCLRTNHNVTTVGEAEMLAKITLHQNHKRRTNCRCAECKTARDEKGCPAPYKCMSKAMELIRALPPKWNPLSKLPEDDEPDAIPGTGSRNSALFDWRLTTTGTLADAFRIFTEGETNDELPTRQWDQNIDPGANAPVLVYTDGSCSNDTNGPEAGAGIHFPDDTERDRAIKIPQSLKQTNQTGEIIA
ncbi:hypothetical protein FB446DRAFT_647504, partial [Lentinula raphanica]